MILLSKSNPYKSSQLWCGYIYKKSYNFKYPTAFRVPKEPPILVWPSNRGHASRDASKAMEDVATMCVFEGDPPENQL